MHLYAISLTARGFIVVVVIDMDRSAQTLADLSTKVTLRRGITSLEVCTRRSFSSNEFVHVLSSVAHSIAVIVLAMEAQT